ncbi:MAG: hypothetical protein RR348_03490, partial [Clostridia bacterium]
GLKKDDYYKYTNTTDEDLKKKYRDTAAKNSKIQLVLEAIMKDVQIPIGEDDIEESIKELATKANKSVDDFKKTLNDEYMNYIRNDITSSKLFEFLKNNNNIK